MSDRHFILNKPFGYISQLVDNSTKRNGLLGELYTFPEGTMAVGRLDKASEGLLLLTTNGKLSNFIRSSAVEKEYFVQVDGIISDAAIEKMKAGVTISLTGTLFNTAPCEVKRIEEPQLPPRPKNIRNDKHGPTSWISVTIKEGKNRQVRKMTSVVGYPTLRLIRWRISTITLQGVDSGTVLEVETFCTLIDKNFQESLKK